MAERLMNRYEELHKINPRVSLGSNCLTVTDLNETHYIRLVNVVTEEDDRIPTILYDNNRISIEELISLISRMKTNQDENDYVLV